MLNELARSRVAINSRGMGFQPMFTGWKPVPPDEPMCRIAQGHLRIQRSSIWLLTPLMLLLSGAMSQAASSGVQDNAHFFSAAVMDQANQVIQQIDQRHHKDVLIETFQEIPPQFKDQGYEGWAQQEARDQAVDGVLMLITRNPGHLQVWVGNKTQMRLFTLDNRNQLQSLFINDLRQHQYDKGLLDAVHFVQRQMDSHTQVGQSTVPPAANYPAWNYGSRRPDRSWGIGGLACMIIAVVLVIVMIRGIFGRSGGSYYGGPGGYYPPQGGAYPPGGYYGGGYGGGGGGFGRGFLGGLLGGALGGYAAQQWTGHQQGGGGYSQPSGGYDPSSGVDTSGTSSGADFDSGGSSGGDFGGGGGGGDFGGGGGDFGGGGGDSGGSGGGDF